MRHRLRTGLISLTAAAVCVGPFAGAASAHPPEELSARSSAAAEGGRAAVGAKDVAHPKQHGGREGHLLPRQENVEVVGKGAVENAAPGRVGDVAVLGDYAYLASYFEPDCTDGGVYIMDIADLAEPEQVGFVPTGEGSYVGEGVQVMSVETASFDGDLLLFNNEICELTEDSVGGATLVDVSDPLNPQVLASGFGDMTPEGVAPGVAHQVHSALMWQYQDKVYAVLVDDEEFEDVDFFDITDPRNPTLVAEYDLVEQFPSIVQEGLDEIFFHDVTIRTNSAGRMTMLASYWDAGYVKFDVTNPARIRLMADTDFTDPDPEFLEQVGEEEAPEGNAHQAEFTPDGQFVIGTDEDFSPYRSGKFSITTGPNAGEYPSTAVGGGGTAAELPDKLINGPVVYGGYGCPDSAAIPPAEEALAGVTLASGEERIVVLQRGPVDDPSAPEEACFPGEKAAEALEAGYDAVVLVNRHQGSAEADAEAEPNCGSGAFPPGDLIPTVCTTHQAFHLMFGSEPAFDLPYVEGTEPEIGAVGDRIEVDAVFNGWGYVHLFTNDVGTMRELDTYAIPEAMDERYASRFGDLSVHEVATSQADSRLAYLAYYAGGFRVVEISRGKLHEVGSFIDEGGNNFWGVEVFSRDGVEYVAASDRDFGLYIFRYTGD
jgi:PA domain/LVIVD repeat